MTRPVRARWIVLFVLTLLTRPAWSSPAAVCLSISASDEHEVVTSSDPWTGDRTLYVWTAACIVPTSGSAFEFVGSLEVVDVIPRPGVVNEGTVAAPVLRYPSCVDDRAVVAEIVVRDVDGSGGSVCFGGPEDGVVSCGYLCEAAFCTETSAAGFATTGEDPCPWPVSVGTPTWSVLKARFQ